MFNEMDGHRKTIHERSGPTAIARMRKKDKMCRICRAAGSSARCRLVADVKSPAESFAKVETCVVASTATASLCQRFRRMRYTWSIVPPLLGWLRNRLPVKVRDAGNEPPPLRGQWSTTAMYGRFRYCSA